MELGQFPNKRLIYLELLGCSNSSRNRTYITAFLLKIKGRALLLVRKYETQLVFNIFKKKIIVKKGDAFSS